MKTEAIIIDGKKYAPIKSYHCVNCALYKKRCPINEVRVCGLFDGHAVKRIKDEQSKDK